MFFKKKFYRFIGIFLLLSPVLSLLGEEKYKTITLTKDSSYSTSIQSIISDIYYINGEIDSEKNYLLVTASNGDTSESTGSPYLLVTKENEFDPEQNEYDYSVTMDNYLTKRLIMPSQYFYSGTTNGFFLNITCVDRCVDIVLKIECIDKLVVDIGERFYFYAKDEDTTFNFTVKATEVTYTTLDTIAFIVSGGNENVLSMKVDSNMAYQKLPNVFSHNKVSLGEDSEVSIKVSKGIKFFFTSHVIGVEEDESIVHYLFEGEYNQYFMVRGNRDECFVFTSSNDYEDNKYDVTIVGQKGFTITLEYAEEDTDKAEYEVDTEENFLSYNLETKVGLEKICINSKQLGFSVIQVHVHEKFSSLHNVKMPEPQMDNVNYIYALNGKNDINYNQNIRLHSNDYLQDKDLEYFEIQGVNVGIQVLRGNVQAYRIKCKTYPQCYVTEETIKENIKNEDYDSDFRTLYPVNGYINTVLSSSEESNSSSNHRNIIAVVCNEESNSLCIYQIIFYGIQDSKRLHNGNMLTKYLGAYKEYNSLKKQDKYDIFLHKNKKIIVELVVYSGDAFIVPSMILDQCTFEEHHLGSNERRIFFCDDDFEMGNYVKYSFRIQAKEDGAVYSLYIEEKDKDVLNDQLPIEMTTMESIHEKSRNITIEDIYLKNDGEIRYSTYLTLFNTINCDLKIKNSKKQTEYFTTGEEIIADIYKAPEEFDNKIYYNIQKIDSTHADEKNCLYYVSSSYLLNEESYLLLPESKPFRIKLNKDMPKVRVLFPFASVREFPKIYLGIKLFKDVPIKVTVQVGYAEPKEHIMFQSEDIEVIDYVLAGLRLNSLVPIKITCEFLGDNLEQETSIDLKIKTTNQVPYSIKSEEYFSDIVNYNNTQYYITLVSQGSRGDILLNFKRGTGAVYGRLVSSSEKKEVNGWNGRINLPNEKTKNLLNYNFYDQKLTFTKEDTEKCEIYCYLIFGVKPQDEKKIFGEEFTSSYSLYFRYFNEDEFDYNFIKLPNNEFIHSSITNEQNDYFLYKIQHDSDEILIDFKSDYCLLTLAFNSEDFSNEKKSKTFESQGANKIFRIKKEEILKLYQEEGVAPLTSIENLTFYIKVSRRISSNNSIDIDKLDMKYRLRINSPIVKAKNYINVDTNKPVYCEPVTNDKGENYCDYFLKLDNFDFLSEVEMLGISSANEDLKIYGKIMDSNEFTEIFTQNGKVEWPNKDNYLLPSGHNPQNFLKIIVTDFPTKKKDDNELVDPRVLIRVYSSGKAPMELITNLVNPQKYYTPSPKDYQLFSADNQTGIEIVIPTDHSYNIHIITISGKGLISLDDWRKQTLQGKYDSLILNTEKNELTEIRVIAVNDKKNEDYDSNFRFFLWYAKSTNEKNMEKLSFGSGNRFALRQRDFPLNYFIKISNTEKDLPFNIGLKKLSSYEGHHDSRDSNSTEFFNIKGYLLTESKFIELQTNPDYKLGKELLGSYDVTLHQGNLIIESKDLKEFSQTNKENEPMYAYITVEKPAKNRRDYYFLQGGVSVFSSEEPSRTVPSNMYLINRFKAHKGKEPIKHIFNLKGLSNMKDKKINVDFSSLSDQLTIKFVKDPKSSTDDSTYFDVKHIINKKDYGKDIYIINKNPDQAYLLIECPETDKDIEYMFRYTSETYNKYPYTYKNTIITQNELDNGRVNITLDKVKNAEKGDEVKANYYIRAFEENALLKENTISIAPSNIHPYAVYKVSYEDEILKQNGKTFNVEIQVNLKGKYLLDIVAEIIEENNSYEFVGYKLFHPELKEEEKGTRNFEDGIVYLIFGICGLFLILVIVLVAFSFIYKRKNVDLQKRVEDISFRLSQQGTKGNLLVGEDDENNALN